MTNHKHHWHPTMYRNDRPIAWICQCLVWTAEDPISFNAKLIDMQNEVNRIYNQRIDALAWAIYPVKEVDLDSLAWKIGVTA